MTQNEILKKTASAIRELVQVNEKLAQENGIYNECVKLAFDMAQRGIIESDQETIVKKAEELFKDRDELPVVKKAMELDRNYDTGIKLEKSASTGEDFNSAEQLFYDILNGRN